MNFRKDSKVSFAGYLGAERYGSQENREALRYRLNLTPERINDIMRSAPSTDEGLLAVYRKLAEESKHVDQAFLGFNAINKQYMFVANEGIKRLFTDYVESARTRVIGSTKHLASRVTGGRGRLEESLKDIASDFDDINQTYLEQGLNPLVGSYCETNKYFQEGIEYVNMRKGDLNWREKLLEHTKKLLEKYEKPYENLVARLEKQGDLLVNNSNNVIEQYRGQTGKSVWKVAKWGRRIARIFIG